MYRGNDILANDNQEVTRDVRKLICLSYCFNKDTPLEYSLGSSPFVHRRSLSYFVSGVYLLLVNPVQSI